MHFRTAQHGSGGSGGSGDTLARMVCHAGQVNAWSIPTCVMQGLAPGRTGRCQDDQRRAAVLRTAARLAALGQVPAFINLFIETGGTAGIQFSYDCE